MVTTPLRDDPSIRAVTPSERSTSQQNMKVTRTGDKEMPSLLDIPEREREAIVLPSGGKSLWTGEPI